jgi:hypothetical protein
LPRGLSFRDAHHRLVKAQNQSLETLQQGVVQFARDAFSLRQSLLEQQV